MHAGSSPASSSHLLHVYPLQSHRGPHPALREVSTAAVPPSPWPEGGHGVGVVPIRAGRDAVCMSCHLSQLLMELQGWGLVHAS